MTSILSKGEPRESLYFFWAAPFFCACCACMGNEKISIPMNEREIEETKILANRGER